MKTPLQKTQLTLLFFFLITSYSYGQIFNPIQNMPKERLVDFERVIAKKDWTQYELKNEFIKACVPRYLELSEIKEPFGANTEAVFIKAMLGINRLVSFISHVEANSSIGVDEATKLKLDLLSTAKDEHDYASKRTRFQTPTLEEIERHENLYLWYEHVKTNWVEVYNESKPKGEDCKLEYQVFMRPFLIYGNRVDWEIKLVSKLTCDCEKKDTEVEVGNSTYLMKARSQFFDTFPFNLAFTETGPLVRKIDRLRCCEKEQEPDEDGEPDEQENGGSSEDTENGNKDQGYYGGRYEDGECCSNDMPKNSIDVIPGIALTNNFEDTSYDVAIRYMRAFGEFGKGNKVYGGAQVGYMSVQTQGGDVTQHMVYGGTIAENRIPILPCLNWSQGVSATYGSGSVENPATKDDFTQLSFGVHTGLNLQFNQQFAIGVDLNLIRFGTTTFTSEMGQEFEQEIGSLTFNKQMPARLGVRFSF